MKNYKEEFQKLVNEAIKDNWIPIWIDRVEGNDCALSTEDDANQWFTFYFPEE